MDESYAKKTFSTDQGALFARDALETILLIGEPEYRSLLGTARWISGIYPTAFARRSASPGAQSGRNTSAWKRAFNQFLFVLAGTFVGAKSSGLNRLLSRERGSDSAFTIRKGADHLIYESKRYARLKSHYSTLQVRPGEPPTEGQPHSS
jgi:hypothetical protein